MTFAKALRWLTTIVSLAAVASMVLVLYWVAQPTSVLEIKNDPAPVKPVEIEAGNEIKVTVDFCKNRKATGKVKVYLVGETKGQKPEINWPLDSTEPQCVKFDVPVTVPASAQTDKYHVVFETTYKVNPLKEQVVIFRSRSFDVANTKLQRGDAKPVVE